MRLVVAASLFSFLAHAALGVTCPSDALAESSFVGTNFCADGAPAAVGPGMLSSSSYDVAAFYFGAQYCGICKQKLAMMYDAWERLPAESKARTLVAGFGKQEYSAHNPLFCKGTLSSAEADALWSAWGIQQRDMVILVRTDSETWRSYCKFSMNLYDEDFERVLHHVLAQGANAFAIGLGTGGAISSSRGMMGPVAVGCLVAAVATSTVFS
ncbi:unnamed protein product [Symbiodinium natans]|uniref:Thioredoxin-like fold domain-containing protein n=1 Tax=Symbiodinium natans TaxID=878477 RepID=A0A812U878_9DINO|nr:unnamed protein product [Symbiodinium natans]